MEAPTAVAEPAAAVLPKLAVECSADMASECPGHAPTASAQQEEGASLAPLPSIDESGVLDVSSKKLLSESPRLGTPRLRRRRSSFSVADVPGSEATRSAVVLLASTQIGAGSSGTAFSVANPVDRQRYVMKRVPIVNLEMEAVHCSEARLHARVRHRHVVGYQYSWIEKDGDDRSLCILLERCAGELWGLLEEPGRLTPALSAKLTLQVASALQEVHECRIMHRDLSPWNIFLTSPDQDARIGDFGLAAEFPPSAGESPALCHGLETPGAPPLDDSALGSIFAAPELGSPDGYNHKVDIYSCGMIFLGLWMGGDGGAEALVDAIESARKDPDRLPPLSEAAPPTMAALIKYMIAHDHRKRPEARLVHAALKKMLVAAAAPPEDEAGVLAAAGLAGGGGGAGRSQSCCVS